MAGDGGATRPRRTASELRRYARSENGAQERSDELERSGASDGVEKSGTLRLPRVAWNSSQRLRGSDGLLTVVSFARRLCYRVMMSIFCSLSEMYALSGVKLHSMNVLTGELCVKRMSVVEKGVF